MAEVENSKPKVEEVGMWKKLLFLVCIGRCGGKTGSSVERVN